MADDTVGGDTGDLNPDAYGNGRGDAPASPAAGELSAGLRWCVSCQAEYLAKVEQCPVCEAPLQEGRPTPIDEVAPESEEKLAYEFHEWSVESRVMMESLLVSAGVIHAWQGTTLMVRPEDEPAVDAVVDEVEAATLPAIDPEADLLVFESGDWSGEHQATVISVLVADEIPHGFDGDGDLVVESGNAEAVATIVEQVLAGGLVVSGSEFGRQPDGTVGSPGSFDEAEEVFVFGEERLQGLEAQELLGDLFVASNRMAKHPRHPKSVETVLDRADSVERAALPFGFERSSWRDIVDSAVVIRDQITDDDAEEEELMASAAALCRVLRPYV